MQMPWLTSSTRTGGLNRQSGLSLVELMVSMTVFSIVAMGIITVSSNGMKYWMVGTDQNEIQRTSRVLMDSLSREIRESYHVYDNGNFTVYGSDDLNRYHGVMPVSGEAEDKYQGNFIFFTRWAVDEMSGDPDEGYRPNYTNFDVIGYYLRNPEGKNAEQASYNSIQAGSGHPERKVFQLMRFINRNIPPAQIPNLTSLTLAAAKAFSSANKGGTAPDYAETKIGDYINEIHFKALQNETLDTYIPITTGSWNRKSIYLSLVLERNGRVIRFENSLVTKRN